MRRFLAESRAIAILERVSDTSPPRYEEPGIGLVLAGGAARGAYEVGVLEHLVEHVSHELGYDVPLDILSGTSVGAINVCVLAAFADEPRSRVARLAAVWTGLEMATILRPAARGMFDVARGLLGRGLTGLEAGALFDPTPLAETLERAIPFERIDTHIRAGRVRAVTVSATQVATGRPVVFVQRRRAYPDPWPTTHQTLPKSVRLRPVHALASSAVPLLFPAVPIDGRYYCDGGLRQNVPLSPARRLGARALIVVNPKYAPPAEALTADDHHGHETAPSPLSIIGKTLSALLLDRIDNELDRFEKVNEILEAGTRRFGDEFVNGLNTELGFHPTEGLQRIGIVHLRSSANIPQLAAEYVREPRFRVPGLLGRLMKRVADDETMRDADLLSYLLFDGEFAGRLIELGRVDARAHHVALCKLIDDTVGLRMRAK
ncbi:MAG: patatin-like phospholipase family protein [Myxococcales bacterium]|nr:patatin-like phospholipase family protein [Myxococcales bacterium]